MVGRVEADDQSSYASWAGGSRASLLLVLRMIAVPIASSQKRVPTRGARHSRTELRAS
jgi:hypothetical protein